MAPTKNKTMITWIRRHGWRLIGLFIVTLTVLVALLPYAANHIAGSEIGKQLGSETSLRIASASLSHLALRDIVVSGKNGHGIRLESVDVEYLSDRIAEGVIKSATLSGLMLEFRKAEEGWQIAGLEAFENQNASDQTPKIPFTDKIRVVQSTIDLISGSTRIRIPFSATTTRISDNSLQVDLSLSPGQSTIEVSAVVDLGTKGGKASINATDVDAALLGKLFELVIARDSAPQFLGTLSFNGDASFSGDNLDALSGTIRSSNFRATAHTNSNEEVRAECSQLTAQVTTTNPFNKGKGEISIEAQECRLQHSHESTESTTSLTTRRPKARIQVQFQNSGRLQSATIETAIWKSCKIDSAPRSDHAPFHTATAELEGGRIKGTLDADNQLHIAFQLDQLASTFRTALLNPVEEISASQITMELSYPLGEPKSTTSASLKMVAQRCGVDLDRTVTERDVQVSADVSKPSLSAVFLPDGSRTSLKLGCERSNLILTTGDSRAIAIVGKVQAGGTITKTETETFQLADSQVEVSDLLTTASSPQLRDFALPSELQFSAKQIAISPTVGVSNSQINRLSGTMTTSHVVAASQHGSITIDEQNATFNLQPDQLEDSQLSLDLEQVQITSERFSTSPFTLTASFKNNTTVGVLSNTAIRHEWGSASIDARATISHCFGRTPLSLSSQLNARELNVLEYEVPIVSLDLTGNRELATISINSETASPNLPFISLKNAHIPIHNPFLNPSISEGRATVIFNPDGSPELGTFPITTHHAFSASEISDPKERSVTLHTTIPKQSFNYQSAHNRLKGKIQASHKLTLKGSSVTPATSADVDFTEVSLSKAASSNLNLGINLTLDPIKLKDLLDLIASPPNALAEIPNLGGSLHVDGNVALPDDVQIEGISAVIPIDLSSRQPKPNASNGKIDASLIRYGKYHASNVTSKTTLTRSGLIVDGTFSLGPISGTFNQRTGWDQGVSLAVTGTIPDQQLQQAAYWKALEPRLKNWAFDGRISVGFEARYQNETLSAHADGSIRNLNASNSAEDFSLENLNLTASFPDLLERRSAPCSLSVETIRFGKERLGPMTASSRSDSAQSLTLENLEMHCFGGKIITGPTRVNPDKLDLSTNVICEGLDIHQLLSKIPDFSGTASGSLYGRIPVNWKDGKFSSTDAFLYSIPGDDGAISITELPVLYDALEGNPQGEKIQDALRSFRYSSISVKMNAPPDENAIITTRLRGFDHKKREWDFRIPTTLPLTRAFKTFSKFKNLW